MSDDITIELVTSIPEGFIMSAWGRGYERLCCSLYGLSAAAYYREVHPQLEGLLRTDNVALARLADDPDVYLGWACGRASHLHYVYVKQPFRERGFGGRLAALVCHGEPTTYGFLPPSIDGSVRRSLLRYARDHGWQLELQRFERTTHPTDEDITRVKNGKASEITGKRSAARAGKPARAADVHRADHAAGKNRDAGGD